MRSDGRYIRVMRVLHDQERATHGYSTDLLTIKLAARTATTCVETLNGEATATLSIANSEQSVGALMDHIKGRATTRFRNLQELQHRLNDIVAVQDNMAHQLINVLRHSGYSMVIAHPTEAERCLTPYKSVVLRLMNSKQVMSEFYNRPQLRISSCGADPFPVEFTQMPALDITTGTLMLAFRNIAENSVKYSFPGETPKLDISWDKKTINQVEHAVFTFRDYGIGVHKKERQLLFREGFRGMRAKQEQLRGNGLGLAVSLKALKEEGGTMEYAEPTDGLKGAIFRVVVKTWRQR